MKKEAEIMDQDMAFYSAIDMLKTMILIPSVSRQEKELAETLEYRLKDLGLKPEKIGNNLILGLDEVDKSKPTILLNSHIDTVKPSDRSEERRVGKEC